MKFRAVANILKRYWAYNIFPAPLAPRFGGGWIGILTGGAVRSLVVSVPYALMLYLLGTWDLFKWSLTAVGFLVYSVLLEIDLSRQRRR
ncbi:hypothetical protein [Burkholderia cepacia]|uniref:hypothetical protein n=1 Tax=Burkholderia cepacia TaxID=292 RepID=UPI00398F3A07